MHTQACGPCVPAQVSPLSQRIAVERQRLPEQKSADNITDRPQYFHTGFNHLLQTQQEQEARLRTVCKQFRTNNQQLRAGAGQRDAVARISATMGGAAPQCQKKNARTRKHTAQLHARARTRTTKHGKNTQKVVPKVPGLLSLHKTEQRLRGGICTNVVTLPAPAPVIPATIRNEDTL